RFFSTFCAVIFFHSLSLHDALPISLSRDLVELQAEKVRGSEGGLVYWLPPEGGSARPAGPGSESELLEARLPRLAEGLLVSEPRSEEHTSELQSRFDLVCGLLLERK